MKQDCTLSNGGSAPATLGFNAVAPEWLSYTAADAAPAIPATESTLRSHPCVALSSAQMLPEWINFNLAHNAFASNGDNPLSFVPHAVGSLHTSHPPPSPSPPTTCPTPTRHPRPPPLSSNRKPDSYANHTSPLRVRRHPCHPRRIRCMFAKTKITKRTQARHRKARLQRHPAASATAPPDGAPG